MAITFLMFVFISREERSKLFFLSLLDFVKLGGDPNLIKNFRLMMESHAHPPEKPHAKNMQDFMRKIRRHREVWGGLKARQNRNV